MAVSQVPLQLFPSMNSILYLHKHLPLIPDDSLFVELDNRLETSGSRAPSSRGLVEFVE